MVAILVWLVVAGRIERIGRITVKLVPSMVLLYLYMAVQFSIPLLRIFLPLSCLSLPMLLQEKRWRGGSVGAVILIGVRRGAFSNEAGIGTESMAHGAAINTRAD